MSKYAYEQIKEIKHLIAEVRDYAKEIKNDISMDTDVDIGDREEMRSSASDILSLCDDIEQLLKEIP
jgi:hypothetical protein